jgi:hypothetical protein
MKPKFDPHFALKLFVVAFVWSPLLTFKAWEWPPLNWTFFLWCGCLVASALCLHLRRTDLAKLLFSQVLAANVLAIFLAALD